jgi:hypothetical protein
MGFAAGGRGGVGASIAILLLWAMLGCATPPERVGQRLFAGCVESVDDDATIRRGVFVCEGPRDPAPFGGNGRACGDCHVPGDRFGISVARIRKLPRDHPLFFPGLDEDPKLLRSHGLIHVIAPAGIDEFRQTPKLTHLRRLCDDDGTCGSLGLLGDRTRQLCAFSQQAIKNHMAKSIARKPGVDFRPATREECEALVAYMLSNLVAAADR